MTAEPISRVFRIICLTALLLSEKSLCQSAEEIKDILSSYAYIIDFPEPYQIEAMNRARELSAESGPALRQVFVEAENMEPRKNDMLRRTIVDLFRELKWGQKENAEWLVQYFAGDPDRWGGD